LSFSALPPYNGWQPADGNSNAAATATHGKVRNKVRITKG